MGNSQSQRHQIPVNQWTHSYPRSKHGKSQVKVLPQRVPPLQLRTTDNGAILQNGGTISCRKQSIAYEERIHRPRSNSAHRPPELENTGLGKGRFGSEPDLRFHLKESKDQYNDNAVRQRISRSRKKYKAPLAPQNGGSSGMESSSPDLNGWETNGKEFHRRFSRKGRLFKTRAETNRKNLTTPRTQENKDCELSRSTETLNVMNQKMQNKIHQSGEKSEKKGLKRSVSQEVISTKKDLTAKEFQAELLEAAERFRPSETRNFEIPLTKKGNAFKIPEKHEVFTRISTEIPNEKVFEESQKITKINGTEETAKKSQKSEPHSCHGEKIKEKNERDVPFKKFYFGMRESNTEINHLNNSTSTNNVNKTNAEHRLTAVEKSKNFMNLCNSMSEGEQELEDTVHKFYSNFHKAQMSMPNGNTTSCSSSFVSDPDEDVDGGIALQLRPTLPKKTPEIPRFSPTAAWRLLSSIDTYCSSAPSPEGSDDIPILLEDRIHPPESQQELRIIHDKSGDSGISGDASPGGCHESSSEFAAASPKAAQNSKNIIMAWTPQQDLEEESSSDDLEPPLNSSKKAIYKIPGARFSPRCQLFMSKDPSFSLTTPREERICLFAENEDFRNRSNIDLPSKLNNLKKLKVALGSTKRSEILEENNRFSNDNWVLSRSMPNSLDNSHVTATRSLSNPSSPEQDDEYNQQAPSNQPSYSYLANGGRMMYLPEYHSRMSPDNPEKQARSIMCSGFLSKSFDNMTLPEAKHIRRSRSPSPAGIRNSVETKFQSDEDKPNRKKKKFTFQSTIRLLENRRIAERLSKEAELKENQRLSELEAMKKVEEEFQRKRAREKANIRYQLKLFNLEEKNCLSLSFIDWEENRIASDRTLMSSSQVVQNHSSSKLSAAKKTLMIDGDKFTPTTQILSEFREPTRNYKDYRHFRSHGISEFLPENIRRSVVEHPRVVYDIPKNTAVYVSALSNTSAQSQYINETRAGPSTLRSSSSDNYRKEFAHGALSNAGKSLTSSDSELSQSHVRPSSRQGYSSREFTVLHRSRSVSPDSLKPSASFHRDIDSFNSSYKSLSNSLVKTSVNQKNSPISPRGFAEVETGKQSELPLLEGESSIHTRLSENELSSLTEPQSKSLQIINFEGMTGKLDHCGKIATDSLLRLGLPSLQPFNKAEKSFRPINFNPVRCKQVIKPT